MKLIKKIIKYLFFIVLGIVSILSGYLLLALLLSRIPVNTDFKQPEKGIDMYIVSNGVHTDLVFPVKNTLVDWSQRVPYSQFADADSACRYISFGWGDRGFYLETPTWADLKTSTAFKAAFFLGTTAMHVDYSRHGYREGKHCRHIKVSPEQYCKMVEYVEASFKTDSVGRFILIPGKGYDKTDNFYEANGTYSFLKTCNVWTNKGLKHGGVRTPLWSPFDKAILRMSE